MLLKERVCCVIDLMLGMHEKFSFRCLLKILWSGWFFGKHLSTMCRKFLPRLVLTLKREGCALSWSFFLLFLGAGSGAGKDHMYVSLWGYPLSLSACWLGVMDLSNTSLLDGMLVSLLLMGCFLVM